MDRRAADRRRSCRHRAEAAIRFLRAGGEIPEVLPGELLDVSATGVRLLLDGPLAEGDRLMIEIRDEDRRCVNLAADVVWVESTGGCFRIGCQLPVSLTPHVRGLLAIFRRR
jgi:hypothetical protein